MTDKLDRALDALGIDPANLDPQVLESLRTAAAAPPAQLSREDLAGMTPEQIVKAKADGKLAQIMGGDA